MKVSEGGFKRFKLIISEGSLPQCEEKSGWASNSAALVRDGNLYEGCVGSQVGGSFHRKASAGHRKFREGGPGEGKEGSDSAVGGAPLLRVTVATTDCAARSAELLQGVPRGFARRQFNGSVRVRWLGLDVRAIVNSDEFVPNGVGVGPRRIASECGDFVKHRYY